jgi:hypothetical protein
MLDSGQAWSAKHNNVDQWMVIDAGSRCCVRGVIISGRGHTSQHQKVTRVAISIGDEQAGPWLACGEYDCHTANEHAKTRVVLKQPRVGRFVKLNPRKWEHHVSMRAGLIIAKSAITPRMNRKLEPLRQRLVKLDGFVKSKACHEPILLVSAPFMQVRPSTVAALVSAQDLPHEFDLFEVLQGAPPRRRKCPECRGLGTRPGCEGAAPQPKRQHSGNRTALQAVWAFESAANGGTWTCYDAKMTQSLEAAWTDGPGAIVHVTSTDGHFEYVVDLSTMVQTAVLTGESRSVMRRELDGNEQPFSVAVPVGAKAGTRLTVDTPLGPVEAVVPSDVGAGDTFHIGALSSRTPTGAGVTTDGTLTLVGMCDYLSRELGVEGSLQSKVLSACAMLGKSYKL